MDTSTQQPETGCCKRFNPQPWEEKTLSWNDKLFIKDRVRSFFHIPLNMGKVITSNMEKIEKAYATVPENLILMDEHSKWGADLYIAVDKEVPHTQKSSISGTFLTKVFEGPYKNAGKWAKEMQEYVKSKNKELKKLYFFYTTCPQCYKAYGKNYAVLLAKV